MAEPRSPYATNKLAWHPEVLEALRRGEDIPPVFVQLFPTGVCQQACAFCSYSSGPESIRAKIKNPPRSAWKNAQLYAPKAFIPWPKAQETVECLAEMSCKAVEISGGGEPTLYPQFSALVDAVAARHMDVALVTNGVSLDDEKVQALAAAHFIWARVSIDAGTREDYVATRNCPDSHWEKAWWAVKHLVAQKRHPQAAVGVGFVVDRDNWAHLYEACQLARDFGADNIRLSVAFTPERESRWADVLLSVLKQVDRAKHDFAGPAFQVNDLAVERVHNVKLGRQLYAWCAWKDVACVIGHDQNVFACCSWAGNKAGVMFSIAGQSFKEGWFGDGAEWRKQHDPRRDCRIHCLMEARNKEAIHLVMEPDEAAAVAAEPAPPHVDFV